MKEGLRDGEATQMLSVGEGERRSTKVARCCQG